MKNKSLPKLGRGLESLLSSSSIERKSSFLNSGKMILTIPISSIKTNPYQPRKHFNDQAIDQLAHSLKTHGLQQPVVVRRVEDGYELIAGERRLRASQKNGESKIQAVVRQLSDKEALQVALVENLDREDLTAIETAKGYQRLIEEFQINQQELSQIFHKNRSTISNTLRLLQLPKRIQDFILDSSLSEGHGRALLALESAELMLKVAERIVKEALSVREVELLIRQVKENEKEIKPRNEQVSLFPEFQNYFSSLTGSKVTINGSEKKGRIIISYKSKEELESIIVKIKNQEKDK